MLFSYLTSFLLGLFLFSTAVDSRTDETLELKFRNRNFRVSPCVMCAMLKKANLENNGYQKRVISNVVKEPGSNISNFQTVYVYYKSVKCSHKAILEAEQQLNTSLPGVIEQDMLIKVRKGMRFRHLNNAGLQCKIKLEVNFHESLGCDMRRRKRAKCVTTTTTTTTTTSSGSTTTTTTTTVCAENKE